MTIANQPVDEFTGKARRRLFGPLRLSSVVGEGLWALSAKIFSQAAQLAVFILAARILTPAEFGLFAFTAAIAVLLATLAENGLGEFVMKSHDAHAVRDQVATMAVITGGLMMAVGLATGAIIGEGFGNTREGWLIAFFGLWLLPASLSAVYDGMLIALGRLRAQSAIRIAAEATGVAVAAAGLLSGYNVFSLVAGRLAMQLVCLFGAAGTLRWVPSPGVTWTKAVEIAAFSRHILANRLIIFARSYSGAIAIGTFLGLTEAGFYRAAERIVAAFSELVGESARMLAWTVFRRAAAEGEKNGNRSAAIGDAATRFMAVLMAISAPIYFGLAVISHDLIHLVLGEVWASAAILVAILSARQIFLVCGYVTEALLSLSGTIDRMPNVLLLNGAVSIALMVALAPFGMLPAALGQGLAALFSIWTSVRLQGRHGGLAWGKVLRGSVPAIVATAAMIVAALSAGHLISGPGHDVASLAVKIAAGGVAYVCVLVLLARRSNGVLAEYFMSASAKREQTA